jgi:hypothetical protein
MYFHIYVQCGERERQTERMHLIYLDPAALTELYKKGEPSQQEEGTGPVGEWPSKGGARDEIQSPRTQVPDPYMMVTMNPF